MLIEFSVARRLSVATLLRAYRFDFSNLKMRRGETGMSAVDLSALQRQLEHKNCGYAGRVSLMARARQRLEEQIAAQTRLRDASIKALSDLESDRRRLDEMVERYGVSRARTEVDGSGLAREIAVFDRKAAEANFADRGFDGLANVVVIDATSAYERTDGGFVWRLPTALAEGPTQEFSNRDLGANKMEGHVDRGLAVPGYTHLAYLVQTQWMSSDRLDAAVKRAVGRATLGEGLTTEFLGDVIDGAAAGKRGDGFWAERAKAKK